MNPACQPTVDHCETRVGRRDTGAVTICTAHGGACLTQRAVDLYPELMHAMIRSTIEEATE